MQVAHLHRSTGADVSARSRCDRAAIFEEIENTLDLKWIITAVLGTWRNEVQQPSSISIDADDGEEAAEELSDLMEALPVNQKKTIDDYLNIMLNVNKTLNLTAIRDKDDAYIRHVADSLALLPVIEKYATHTNGLKVIDVGSGAGLPGMILAIVRPDWSVTLLDTLGKRINFINSAAQEIGVGNARGLWARAEDAGKNKAGFEEREAHDVVIARAVAEMRILAELCLPLVPVGGIWVAAKGVDPSAELAASEKAIEELGGELVAIERVGSQAPEGYRTAVIVRKVRPTPAKYPRRAGLPNKRPL
ncbi:hypothetical protein CYMTET_42129 [Cymbomonas tetramitiformis]|uniref:Ribosomal RNA small subunit methyltransferase G n=1 Tax=Cymbomonas tetramitiformis TaxID=36881 RepID=A0AAE0C614_9CHLO|nr:hypothetical protein CYMTET_42129 [Cymbomonas tetramitiformis]